MSEYKYKLNNSLYPLISRIHKINILEFGVQKGRSTLKFLDICNKNDGFLFSADIDDCSNVSKDPRWTFIKSRDDNFEFLKKKLPNNVDVIFLDTLHKADHVIKILIEYFDNLKEGGYFIIDDISWIPYLKKNLHDHFYKEINNKETFESLLQIYSLNFKVMDIKFNLTDTGSVIIKKLKDEKLFFNKKRLSRDNSLKNYLRLIYKKIFN